ncbi:MAG: hypothetical protein J7M26_04130 [Armatimonadetes bacterium]|nr:hypothetical protein [Armatimonadota bacterium]
MSQQPQREASSSGGKSKWTFCCLGCAGMAFLGLLAVVGLYFYLRSSPPLPQPVREALQEAAAGTSGATASPAPQPSGGAGGSGGSGGQPAPAASVPSVEAQANRIGQAIQQGYTGSLQLVITEADLNSQLASSLPDTLSSVTCAILDGQVVAKGTARLPAGSFDAVIEIEPRMDNGQPRLVITRAYIGRFSLPQDKLQQLQSQLDKALQSKLAEASQQGVQITGVRAVRGRLIVEGYATGRRR